MLCIAHWQLEILKSFTIYCKGGGACKHWLDYLITFTCMAGFFSFLIVLCPRLSLLTSLTCGHPSPSWILSHRPQSAVAVQSGSCELALASTTASSQLLSERRAALHSTKTRRLDADIALFTMARAPFAKWRSPPSSSSSNNLLRINDTQI